MTKRQEKPIFILFEHRAYVQLDFMKRYPKSSIYVFVARDFCDGNGKVYSMMDRTAWT